MEQLEGPAVMLRELLKGSIAMSRDFTCEGCGSILDARRTVHVQVVGSAPHLLCGECFDSLTPRMLAAEAETGAVCEYIDGRKLWK